MEKIKLLPHQERAIQRTSSMKRVAYYHDMGLGKTFTGSEKLISLGYNKNLIICQKSKIIDWKNHIKKYYDVAVFDLTENKKLVSEFLNCSTRAIAIINYDLVFRREQLLNIENLALLLDESSLIQNEKAKRTKFILSLKAVAVVLLSGTPVGGKYENLYSQLKLLNVRMTKSAYWNKFIRWHLESYGTGIPFRRVDGYKNVDELVELLQSHGADFLKTSDVLELPEQNFIKIEHPTSKEYRNFLKTGIFTGKLADEEVEFIGDNPLKKLLYVRQLCSYGNSERLERLKDLIESCDKRLVIFYNFNAELAAMKKAIGNIRPFSEVNGTVKNLSHYEKWDNSITFVQYQSGAMGLNLQKADTIIYFSLPLSSELFEQSKKRIHRLGQQNKCTYYIFMCENSVEQKIYSTLQERKDYTDKLFEKDFLC